MSKGLCTDTHTCNMDSSSTPSRPEQWTTVAANSQSEHVQTEDAWIFLWTISSGVSVATNFPTMKDPDGSDEFGFEESTSHACSCAFCFSCCAVQFASRTLRRMKLIFPRGWLWTGVTIITCISNVLVDHRLTRNSFGWRCLFLSPSSRAFVVMWRRD